MSFALPLAASPLRELFAVADLVPFGTAEGRAKCPTLRQALAGAEATMVGDSAISAVHSICICADGSVRLVRFGKLGGILRLWNFSK